ncbi:uncharacterized protein LOC112345635 [Selaginella moellendorffii]|uniref:uncharacterized protein LOC112345635 n=1 Tax=Selaginella moellendorffii TaxID=88036 RepID=UPI000D1C8127|nr:uncharacterized protein LOC112345635 [Selaginella moellendorffii]|eukprot:XP_024528610.1 uncharacterized protein LOC112345635 [Selaginella moellendorffii]
MADEEVQHVFVYGNLRPDAGGPQRLRLGSSSRGEAAWLLGGRLFCVNSRGRGASSIRQAAVSLDEPGNAVKGYVVSASDPSDLSSLLHHCDSSEEHQGFDRDVVEVVTEAGKRVAAFVYHCPQVDRSMPVHGGDWMSHPRNL